MDLSLVRATTLPPQAFCGSRPERAEFQPHRPSEPSGFKKPSGGLWTSTAETMYEEGWIGWCRGEQWGDHGRAYVWVIQPVECRVIEIGSLAVHEAFHEQYGVVTDGELEFTERFNRDYRDLEFTARRPERAIDWTRVGADCDAVRLTIPYAEGVRFGRDNTFYGWDCESTYWFRWMFRGRPEKVALAPFEEASYA